MTLIKRGEVVAPVLPQMVCPMPSLGADAEVLVRGMLLSARLSFGDRLEAAGKPLPGESEQDAKSRAGVTIMGELLAATVVDAEGEPVFNAHEWAVNATVHFDETKALFDTAWRLCGFDSDAVEKN